MEPETTHVHGFGAALLDGAVGDANSGTVIAGSVGGGGLGMAHFFKGSSNGDSVLAVAEHATSFGFSGGGDDNFKDCAVGVHGASIRGKWWIGC